MPERLGCLSDLQVFVTDKCSAPRLCQLTNIVSVQWNRKLDEISEASITVALSDPECCECMASIEPWCHMIHIIRNGDIVWQGPVTRITYGYESVTIEARDILAFLEVTVPKGSYDNITISNKNGGEITDLAVDILEIGFAERDSCFTANIVQTDLGNNPITGQPIRPTLFSDTLISEDNGFVAFEGSIFDWLTILAENGLDYTVIGLTIVLGVEATDLPAIGVLTDEHIRGEIAVSKDGYLMTNRVYVRYEGDDIAANCAANCGAGQVPPIATCPLCNDAGTNTPCYNTPCPATAEVANKSCYGPIERVFDNGEVGNFTTAQQTANAYASVGSFAPRTVEFPGGTSLSADTPWDINSMIPGQRVNTAFTGICLDTFQVFVLQGVEYNLDADGDEEISISLGPLNVLGTI